MTARLTAVLLFLTLSACGQAGPLVLPEKAVAAEPATTPAAPDEEEAEPKSPTPAEEPS